MRLEAYCALCDEVSLAVAAGTQAAVGQLRDQHKGDDLLGFALGGTDYISGFFAVALTTTGLEERMNAFAYPSREAVRFSFTEWRQAAESDLFGPAQDLCDAAYAMVDSSERSDLVDSCRYMFFEAVESGLYACRDAGVFPSDLFVDWGSTDRNSFDDRSRAALYRLNTPEVAHRALMYRKREILSHYATR